MNADIKEIEVNGVAYVPKGSQLAPAPRQDGLEYVIVRTYSAGVFAGYLESRDGKEAAIRDARRLWYWSGAASLSQLAIDGTSKPKECKFPAAVDKLIVTEAIEIISVTEKAQKSIAGVAVWQA